MSLSSRPTVASEGRAVPACWLLPSPAQHCSWAQDRGPAGTLCQGSCVPRPPPTVCLPFIISHSLETQSRCSRVTSGLQPASLFTSAVSSPLQDPRGWRSCSFPLPLMACIWLIDLAHYHVRRTIPSFRLRGRMRSS